MASILEEKGGGGGEVEPEAKASQRWTNSLTVKDGTRFKMTMQSILCAAHLPTLRAGWLVL